MQAVEVALGVGPIGFRIWSSGILFIIAPFTSVVDAVQKDCFITQLLVVCHLRSASKS